jgi:hypothetical protein
MKYSLSILLALMLTIAAGAQTMNVVVGSTTYQFPAAQTGEMNYTNGTSLTVMGKTFAVTDITKIYIDNAEVTDNLVSVNYNGTSATVTVAGNVVQYVEPVVSGAHVTLIQNNTADVDGDEITYSLSGTTTDGEFALSGSYKCTVQLAGLTMTNPSGAAINIVNGKRIQISAKKDTENTLTDGANGSQKACLYSKGQIQLQGQGTLNVTGKTAHAIKSGDYITVKNLTLNVKGAVKDGISCNEYFLMKSGTVSISSVGDDGIQADLDGTTSTGETTDHEDEDSGNIYLQGGTLTINTTAVGAKGIKSAGNIVTDESSQELKVTVTSSGGVDATDSSDLTASACMKADGNITINAGTLTLTNIGQGGRALNSDGAMTFNGGTVNARAQGSNYGSSGGGGGGPWGGGSSSGNHKYAKGVKADGNIVVNGGIVNAYSANHEGLEAKGTIIINGGQVFSQASDDAINSAGDFTISGGYVCGYSTGNDGLDANGNFYIKGGTVYAIGKTSPELGIDANSEAQKKLYVQGGTIVAIGGLESGFSYTQACKSASSWSKNIWYALYNDGNLALAFKTPSSGGSTLVVSTSGTATLKSGVSVSGGTTLFGGMGSTDATASGGTSVTLSSYSGGGGGGPGPRW